MAEELDQDYTSSQPARRRPARRVAPRSEEVEAPATLSEDLMGLTVAYANTLLFIGYEVNGLVEIAVFPRYRFGSDDRVQGHLGYVRVPLNTPWTAILPRVDSLAEQAEENYRTAVSLRASSLRAHGARFESAYDAITDTFRESWHAFKLRLLRDGRIERDSMTFEGRPPEPVLVTWRGEPYTLQVFTTGSILLVRGDRRRKLGELRAEA
ncbi:MAG TPA: hypothetical protein VFR15_17540 [Chloroflexia bacterium]|nr:hypothetical protein [Chloroflexia bacterium]